MVEMVLAVNGSSKHLEVLATLDDESAFTTSQSEALVGLSGTTASPG